MAGLKFFYSVTCPRDWNSLRILRVKSSRTLPVVLSRAQVRGLIEHTHKPQFRAFFQLCYTCGLRLGEAKRLAPGNIDSERGQIIVRNGKGGKDRVVPIPPATLDLLRTLWKTHRNPKLVFPSRLDPQRVSTVTRPFSDRGVQRAFQVLVRERNLPQAGVRLHTLRHSYATHLLEDGVNLKVLQQYLGHRSLQTTAIYLHLTCQGDEHARSIIRRLMEDGTPHHQQPDAEEQRPAD